MQIQSSKNTANRKSKPGLKKKKKKKNKSMKIANHEKKKKKARKEQKNKKEEEILPETIHQKLAEYHKTFLSLIIKLRR